MAQGAVSVTFWRVVDQHGQPVDGDLDWGQWMQHIQGAAVADRTLTVSGGQRLGMVWPAKAKNDGVAHQDRMLVLAADRSVNPSTTDYNQGTIVPANPPPGTAFAERVSALLFPGNVLAAVSLGTAAPRPSSLLQFICSVCGLRADGEPDPIRLEPIPRPDLVEKLEEDGGLVTRMSFTTTLAGLAGLTRSDDDGDPSDGDEPGPGLLGMAFNPDADDAPVNEAVFSISARIDNPKRKQETLGVRGRATGRRLLRAAEKLVERRAHVTHGEVTFLDENDERHVISLAEESLATRWRLPKQQTASLGHDTVHKAINDAYAHWRSHIQRIVAGDGDGSGT